MDITTNDVEDLLRSRTTDDTQVFEAMVRAYRTQLYRLALSILKDADEAEDAVQDIFVRAARMLNHYQVGTNFKAWLYTIAVNACRDALRRRAARSRLNQIWGSLQSLISHTSEPESAAIESESQTRLWDLVEKLSEKHRLVVTLRVGQGCTIQEISQILGIQEKTVYSRLYEAYKQMRQKIKASPEYSNYWNEYLR